MSEREGLKEDITDYVETKVKLIKLKVIEKGGLAISGAITGVLMVIFGFFILLFLSLSAAFGVASATGRPFLGFLVVAGFYILLVGGIIFFKEKLITMPVINALLKKFYYATDEEIAEEKEKKMEEEKA
jgi:hypothetical protein